MSNSYTVRETLDLIENIVEDYWGEARYSAEECMKLVRQTVNEFYAKTNSLIGREDFLMEKLAKQASSALHKHHEITNLRRVTRGYEFDVQVLVDDEPTGYIAKISIELIEVKEQ